MNKPPQTNESVADLATTFKQGAKVIIIATITNTWLAIVKILAGLYGNAYVLIADGFESLLDVVSSLVVLGSLKLGTQPPSEKYPFGLGRVEALAALVLSTVLLVTAGTIAVMSLREIVTPHHTPAPFTLYVLVVVVVIKEVLFRFVLNHSQRLGSPAMQNDAWHHRSDSLTSLAAFIGISVAVIGGPGFQSADDWAALLASAIIAVNGARLFASAFKEVLDVAPPETFVRQIRQIAAAVNNVESIDKCRVRKSGLVYFVEIHVEINGQTSVAQGHAIGHQVKDALLTSKLKIIDVLVHIEPSDTVR